MNSYVMASMNMDTLRVALPDWEPGFRELWRGELVPENAEEWSETIRRWMPPSVVGVPYTPHIDYRLNCRIMRLPTRIL